MRAVHITPTFDAWRDASRALLHDQVAPDQIVWQHEAGLPLFEAFTATSEVPLRVPRRFAEIAERVICHIDPTRFARLYRILWRMVRGERHLLEDRVDDDVAAVLAMDKQVRRDIYTMHAYVRFREALDPDGQVRFVAWHTMTYAVVRLAAPFFVARFGSMRWAILTPHGTALWDLEKLTFGPPAQASDAPSDDEVARLWSAYYQAIFNPARLMTDAMLAQMPKKFWGTMPETAHVPAMIARASERVSHMAIRGTPVPTTDDLAELAQAARRCDVCPHAAHATQTVFGEGPRDARLVLVGEQPGDNEDLQGRVFVGPAGQVLNEALRAADVPRASLYMTNAVKHFRWKESPTGKRRMHDRPNGPMIEKCKPWLTRELELLQPAAVLALGNTAAQSLLGRAVHVTQERGRPLRSHWAPWVGVTVHPSAILRSTEGRDELLFRALVEDLRAAWAASRP